MITIATLLIGLATTLTLAPGTSLAQERGEGLLRDNFWTGPEQVRIEADTRVENRVENRIERQDTRVEVRTEAAVERRSDLLERLSERTNQLRSLSEERIRSLPALAAFTARLEAQTGTSSIREALARDPELRSMSITLPTAAITAMSDRLLTVVSQMETFGAKLDTRISAAAEAGTDVTSARAAYVQYVDLVAQAKGKAEVAASIAATLTADTGTREALSRARQNLRSAHQDLKAARQEVAAILRVLNVSVSAEVN